jgi:hypothetical protein
MRRSIIGLALALVMLASSVAPALAQTTGNLPQTLTATVNINSVLSVTLTDQGASGLNFPDVTPGVQKSEADQNGAQGAVLVELKPESTTDCWLRISGSDFIGPSSQSFPIGALGWTLTSGGSVTAVTSSAFSIAPMHVSDSTNSVHVWHYLTVPAGTKTGTYNATVTYAAQAV